MENIIKSVLEKISVQSSVKTIFGEPINAYNKMIIPVAKISYGFGGGSGKSKNIENEKFNDEPKEGQGFGAGVSAKPLGVIEINEEETKFIPCNNFKQILVFLLIAFSILLFLRRRKNK